MVTKRKVAFKIRWLIAPVVLFILLCTLLNCCQKTEKILRVGIISGVDAMATIADGFKSRMTELGYVEAKNITYDLQKVNADPEGEKRIISQFVKDKVDLILAFPTDTALTAKEATKGTTLPVLFAHGEAVKIGLVDSISRPGGNVTGCRTDPSETTAKNLEILHELAPQAKHIYLIYNPDLANAEPTLGLLRPAASSSGMVLVEDTVNNIEELGVTLEKRDKADTIGVDAILVMPDPINYSPDGFSKLLAFAKKHKIPIGGGSIPMADQGSLFSNFPDNIKIGKAVAVLADKIFKGTDPGTIPIVTPDDYLKLNYKAAQELGLNMSESLLARADEVIR